ncbi:MAG: mechanosensitive ion channel family protein [Cyanobium sp.]
MPAPRLPRGPLRPVVRLVTLVVALLAALMPALVPQTALARAEQARAGLPPPEPPPLLTWPGDTAPGRVPAAISAPAAVQAPPLAPPPAPPPSSWVTMEGRRVLEIRSATGAQTPAEVALRGSLRLRQLAENQAVEPEQLVVREDPPYALIGLQRPGGGFTPQMAVDDRAALAFGTTRQELAERYRDQMRAAIRQYRSTHTLGAWIRSTALATLVLGVYLLWLRIQTLIQRRLGRWIRQGHSPLLEGLRIGSTTVLDRGQERAVLLRLLRLLHWGLLLLASYLLIPLLLGLFPPTQMIAEGLRGHLRGVLVHLFEGAVAAIPNLLTIALILLLTRGLMRACVDWFEAIERGQLQISGFYREWARPTGRLVAATLLLAGLVVAYPYIPGSGSRAFQGAGLFVGLLAALGSSAVATNVISGVMLIYTRAFQEGDRVEINGVTGVVQDRNLLVTRIQTPRNELVSLPNAMVISTPVLNFSYAGREGPGPVTISTTITIGYDVPWRQVHHLMLEAARAVPGIAEQPAPKVLQTALNDFHISYEIDASLQDVGLYRETLSELLASLQDRFAAAGVEILSPGYQANRDSNRSTVPPAWDGR